MALGTAERDGGGHDDVGRDAEQVAELGFHRRVPHGEHTAVAQGTGGEQQVLTRRVHRRPVVDRCARLRRRFLPGRTGREAATEAGQHHHRRRVVKTRELTDDNIRFAFEALGYEASAYLRRYYDDTDPDPRIARLEAAQDALEEAA